MRALRATRPPGCRPGPDSVPYGERMSDREAPGDELFVLGIALGPAFGVVLGVLIGDIGLGVAVGVPAGLILGLIGRTVVQNRRRNDDEEPARSE